MITRLLLLALLLCCASIVGAQTVTLTASPTSGISPLNTTLTWSTAGFPTGVTVACTASGGWTGTKAASGTQTFTGLTATRTYTLTCTGGTEPAVISWEPPTTNTDGTPLTNLSHYQIYHADSPGNVSSATPNPVRVNAPARTYTITGLPTGMRYFAMDAWNTEGVASQLTLIVSKAILALTASANVTVTVTPRPNPPTNVTVGVVTGMNMAPVYNVTSLGRLGTALKGFVPLEVECGATPLGVVRGSTFYEIPTTTVLWWGSSVKRAAAPCAPDNG